MFREHHLYHKHRLLKACLLHANKRVDGSIFTAQSECTDVEKAPKSSILVYVTDSLILVHVPYSFILMHNAPRILHTRRFF